MIYKKHIKEMVKCANDLKAQTTGTQILFNIYSDSAYILDNEEENIIDAFENEEEAKETCAAINSGEYSDGIKSNCYYKPILIDELTGEQITRNNFDLYKTKQHESN
jgi:hypothetical protein